MTRSRPFLPSGWIFRFPKCTGHPASPPSRLGDVLDISLRCTRLGRSSLGLGYAAVCGNAPRFTAQSTIVFIDATGKSQPWTDKIRALLHMEMQGETEDGT
jgi:4-hydroxybenzoyl-CoA thioesterase